MLFRNDGWDYSRFVYGGQGENTAQSGIGCSVRKGERVIILVVRVYMDGVLDYN